MKMLNKLVVSSFIFFTVVGTVFAQTSLLPGKLAIYYAWPSTVNGSGGDTNAATEVFNDYAIVVFGDGLQDAGHGDHANTTTIINNLNTPPNDIAVYGYIPIGVISENLSMAEIQSRVDDWEAMGVAGIFLDEAGYDYGVSRQRQNDAVDYVHSKGLSVFINAWDPDDVFSDAVESTYNPTGEATHLGSNDIYLHESFQIILSNYQDAVFWASKSDKGFNYKNLFGTQMATVTTVSAGAPEFHRGKFDYAWYSTLLYGFELMGWGELYFSASDSMLPPRARPNRGVGDTFTSDVIHSPPVHTRTTTKGTIEVNTNTHSGSFTTRIIEFAGQQWYVKSGCARGPGGPGGNCWSDSEESVWVDESGQLHLKIREVGGTWYCAEVYTTEYTQYGMHRFYTIGRLDLLNENVVAAPFLYANDTTEIDIEFTRWGVPELSYNAQYVVQPWDNSPDNLDTFSMTLTDLGAP